jgi:hypothetical protein
LLNYEEFQKWNMQIVKPITNTTIITSLFSFYRTIAQLEEKKWEKILV